MREKVCVEFHTFRNSGEKRLFMFKRRLGQDGVQQCSTGLQCPQILEMKDGDFAAVGLDIKNEAIMAMPPGPGVGPKEGVVKIPRPVMLAAIADIRTAV